MGPWSYESELPVLGWDNNRSERLHALSSESPTGTKKRGVPGAEWLGLMGLRFFPVATTNRNELLTTGYGRWDYFYPQIAPLLSENHEHLASTERHARGVDRLLRAPIRRADQGGYGSFGPTSPVPPV